MYRPGTTFVGRENEMGELVSALDDTLAGNGRLVMLVGEPGIGKTRTAEEFAAYAQEQGSLVLWGRCHEQQGMPPFWPWVQAIRSYVRAREPDQLRSDMGAGASIIAEIVPDVAERLPDLKPPPELESPEHARFRLFDFTTTFLKNVSVQSNALVLILEDLHWADKPSLLLMEFLSQELSDSRLMIIGTFRDVDLSRQHPLAETLGELTRARLFQRVLLRGLTERDVEQFIELSSGVAPPSSLVRAVHTQTEGNPLFVTEVVRLLVQEGELTGDRVADRASWDVRIPEGLREVIGRRLNRLSARCNDTLTMAAVVGREFSLEQLDRLTEDLNQDMLLDVLEEALAARVIEELSTAVGSYQFIHALIQETLVEELSITRRVRLHARIAEALEELYGDDAEAHAAQLAYHFGEAEAVVGSERLVRYSMMAGERALGTFAYEDAQTHFERALTAKEIQPIDDETAEIYSGLGRAYVASGQEQRAVPSLRRAFDYYEEVGDALRAVAAVEYPYNIIFLRDMKDVLLRALELVPRDSIQSAHLLCSYGLSVGLRGYGYQQAQEAFESALRIANVESDAAMERRIMAASANVDGFHLKWRDAQEKSARVLQLTSLVDDDPMDRLRALFWASLSSTAIGDSGRAQSYATVMLELAEPLHNVAWLNIALLPNVALSILKGDWKSALALRERFLAGSFQWIRIETSAALVKCQVGEFDEAKSLIDPLVGSIDENPRVRAHFSFVLACIARVTEEHIHFSLLEQLALEATRNEDLEPGYAMSAHAALALLAVMRKDTTAAAKYYTVLNPQRGTTTLYGEMVIDHLLGLLAQTMGKLDDSTIHFEDALAFCRKAGYRPELAWTCHDYAALQHAQGQRDEALALIEEAVAISTELGMRPLVERVVALKEQVEPQPAKGPAYPDGLTEREVEVLRLIAAGKSNPEIADTLVLSIRTVTTHITNIFSKTGAANRAEAVIYATRHRLVE